MKREGRKSSYLNDMPIPFLIAALITVVALVGCAQTYLDSAHAFRFIPCPSPDIESPRDRAFEAMISTLADNDWVLEGSSRQTLRIIGRKCTGAGVKGDYLKRPDSECVTINFIVQENSEVLAYNPAAKRMRSSMSPETRKWMGDLDRTFAELRCYSGEKLRERSPVSESMTGAP
jgi:hypothetical protein